jgi:hypothetical protein
MANVFVFIASANKILATQLLVRRFGTHPMAARGVFGNAGPRTLYRKLRAVGKNSCVARPLPDQVPDRMAEVDVEGTTSQEPADVYRMVSAPDAGSPIGLAPAARIAGV